ncbi:isopropyl malate dehydrogenase [Moelleriella libera RCEF 2490]|uniref:Isopropyl malate dehydrogenase n=1 Tax=Moelleriella libera RCEF 2490 TaxID=1081109 RepID=A0A162IN99_9HYPO|nr:isopropyl malate dehydrogenase [Moelleriella libera RCEF 2490]
MANRRFSWHPKKKNQVVRAIEQFRPNTGKFVPQDHLLRGVSQALSPVLPSPASTVRVMRLTHTLVGNQCCIDATGSPLTDEARKAAKSADAVLLRAIGGPKWGTGPIRPEQGLLKLRKEVGTIQDPERLGVSSNLSGDTVSDEVSAILRSIVILPSASLGSSFPGKGIYKPIQGSAPDISRKVIVNPLGTILSVAMMLRYSLNLLEAAKTVGAAVEAAINGGSCRKHMGGNAST